VMARRFRDFMFGTMQVAKQARCYQGDNPFVKDGPIYTLAPIRHSAKPHPGWHHDEMPRLMKLLCAAETDCRHGGLWTTAETAKALGRDRYVVLNYIKKGHLPAKQTSYGKTCTYLIKPTDVAKAGFVIKNPNPEPNFGMEHLAIPVVRFLLLTAVRFSEANEMVWEEINWSARIWTIPAERTKMKIEHKVPLSPPAYEVLKRQRARGVDSRYVFSRGPTLTGIDFHVGDPLTRESIISHLRKAIGDPFITIHSFPRNCRSWAKDRGYPMEIRRTILGHRVGNAVDGTYEVDAQCVEQCRELLEDWARYLTGRPSKSGNVVSRPSKSSNVVYVSITKRTAINA
jgi:hypothetical protein